MKKYYKIRGLFIPATPGYAFATVKNNVFTEHKAHEQLYGIVLEPAHTLVAWKGFEDHKLSTSKEPAAPTSDDNTDVYVYRCGAGCMYGYLGEWCTNCQTECK